MLSTESISFLAKRSFFLTEVPFFLAAGLFFLAEKPLFPAEYSFLLADKAILFSKKLPLFPSKAVSICQKNKHLPLKSKVYLIIVADRCLFRLPFIITGICIFKNAAFNLCRNHFFCRRNNYCGCLLVLTPYFRCFSERICAAIAVGNY